MPNYKLDELLAMNNDEIRSVAQSLGLKTKAADTLQDIAYAIIDEQAMSGSQNVAEKPKRKRATTATKKQSSAKTADNKKTTDSVDNDSTATTAEEPKKRATRTRKTKTVEPAPAADNNNVVDSAAPAEPAANEAVAAPKPEEGQKRVTRRRKTAVAEGDAKAEATPAGAGEDTAAAEAKPEAEKSAPADKTPTTGRKRVSPKQPESDFIILQDVPPLEPNEIPPAGLSPAMKNAPLQQRKKTLDNAPLGRHNLQIRPAAPAPRQTYDFNESIIGSGVLEVNGDGSGFLRSADYNYLPSPDDILVTAQQIKNYGLKMGDVVEGPVRAPQENEKNFPLLKITGINGLKPEQVRDRLSFEHLTPLFPNEKFRLCVGNESDSLSARIVDLFAPIGKGQRALLVAQPKTGKTMIMKSIANAIAANHPEAYLMMLLIDERPEEVTDMSRTVKAEVIASTFDEPASNHVKIANIVLEKAKRMVECGHDVVIFLDSITRLARAYNTVTPASGKILTGGVDANALQKPKRFFGAARNIEGGGSLTIIATALIDTGSRMDELIFEEFKGTGNMELQLDRSLSNKRIFPAVNCVASSTRRDDLLHDKTTLDRMWVLRNHIAEMTPLESMSLVRNLMSKTRNNEEFLISMNS